MNLKTLEEVEKDVLTCYVKNNFNYSNLVDYIKSLAPEGWIILQSKYKGNSSDKATKIISVWEYRGTKDFTDFSVVEFFNKNTQKYISIDMLKDDLTEAVCCEAEDYSDETDFKLASDMAVNTDEDFSSRLDPVLVKEAKDLCNDPDLKNKLFSQMSAGKTEDNIKSEGLRYNSGKLRYDLIHPWSHEQMVRVLTKGSQKYAERNWEKGMKWSNVIASLKRHTAAIERGEDYDVDPNCPDCKASTRDNWICINHTGELHASLAQANAHFLTAYYKIYPQGDDRPKSYLKQTKIGLDIDEVIADFVGSWVEKFPQDKPKFWNFDKDMESKYQEVATDKEFWMSIKPRISPDDLPFEPHCYITSRAIPNKWTEEWLQANGFPAVPVYTVGFSESKVDVAKESGIDIFVDDRFDNFVELNNAGICTFLMDAEHNKRYDVGYRRLYSLKDLM